MKERGIIFNSEMVRAILDGRKTVTRRPVKPEVPTDWNWHGWVMESTDRKLEGKATWAKEPTESVITHGLHAVKCPFGKVGDLLYVRETVYGLFHGDSWHGPRLIEVQYVADGNEKPSTNLHMREWKTVPSIHMPKKYARIWLEITDIRVERVQDITEEKPIAEGFYFKDFGKDKWGNQLPGYGTKEKTEKGSNWCLDTARFAFGNLWDSIYKNWNDNPYVWVIEFKRIEL